MAKARRMRAVHKERVRRLSRGLRQLADEMEQAKTFDLLEAIGIDTHTLAIQVKTIGNEGLAPEPSGVIPITRSTA